MGKINTGKVIIGGLLAGAVMNIIDFIVNVPILGDRWKAETLARGLDPDTVPLAPVGWITVDFIAGLFLLWLYAGIRPRFGAGPKTAVIAGLAMWVLCQAMFSSYWFTGLYSAGLVMSSGLGSLVSSVCGALAGCALYKEAQAS